MWSLPLPLLLLALTATAIRGAGAADNPDDASGKLLYITEPACGYYQCFVDWKQGSSVAVNWLGPPAGSVSVQLISTNGGLSYPVVDSIAGISQEGYCDSGAGLGVVQPGVECGRIEFTVPGGWKPRDNYTIAVQSLSDPSLIGYTDNINIIKGSGGSGTAVSLATISAPTSTNWDAAASFTGKIPDPTAVTKTRTRASSSDDDDDDKPTSTTTKKASSSSSASPSASSDDEDDDDSSRSRSPSSTDAEDSSSATISSVSASLASDPTSDSSTSISAGFASAVATAAPSSGAGKLASSSAGVVVGLVLLIGAVVI